ncbi:hypothetical protein ACJJTC_009373 [Scirpophaga incertulas]
MSKFNLRKKQRISYCEYEEPNLDEYVFCDLCGELMYEYCAVHGPLLVVPDDKVPAKTGFPQYVPRAALTVPRVFLHIALSAIPGNAATCPARCGKLACRSTCRVSSCTSHSPPYQVMLPHVPLGAASWPAAVRQAGLPQYVPRVFLHLALSAIPGNAATCPARCGKLACRSTCRVSSCTSHSPPYQVMLPHVPLGAASWPAAVRQAGLPQYVPRVFLHLALSAIPGNAATCPARCGKLACRSTCRVSSCTSHSPPYQVMLPHVPLGAASWPAAVRAACLPAPRTLRHTR